MSKKREAKLREALDACVIAIEACDWLEENVRADIPDSYRHMSATPVTSHVKVDLDAVRESLERQLGRLLHKPESLFDRLLKAKCGGGA